MVRASPSTAGCVRLIPDQRAKIPHALRPNHNIKKPKKQYFNKLKTLKRIHIKKKKNLKNKTGNSVQCYMAAWMGRDLRGVWDMDTCTCVAESLGYPPETITILLIGYAPIQNS